ncbi:MAG TPA: hypothetical protein VMV10_23750 [Pirellulales bacterium]|nr:hypothetical protein [Pirellulales bacterium]
MPQKAWILLALLAIWGPNDLRAGELFSKIRRDFRRNNCWPQPFVVHDRIAVRSPFQVMIQNGWQVQNTLSDEHFDSETGELLGAGELKVRGILIESPPEHRQVFVLRGKNPQDTSHRQQSVDQYAASILHPGEHAQISESRVRPRGTPAERIVDIDARYSASAPDPRIPSSGGGGASGAGSSGTGAGF